MNESELSFADGHLWTLLAPPAALLVLFFGGFLVYLIKVGLAGKPDDEMRQRGSSIILGPFVRDFFAWLMSPMLRAILASGMPANAVTAMALVFASASGVALGTGHFALGGWLFLFSGFLDFLDGRVARITKQQSKGGALFDSVLDRYAEAALFMGLAWFYRESWILLLVLAAGAGSQLVSYVRARCGDLGIDVGRVGLLQRPERVAILGTSICLSPVLEYLVRAEAPQPVYGLAIGGLAIVAVLSNLTALQRLNAGMKLLSTPAVISTPQRRPLLANPHTTSP